MTAHSHESSDPDDSGSLQADLETVRSLSLLTVGRPEEFARHELPPEAFVEWIDRASLRQSRGLLMLALQRWHALRER